MLSCEADERMILKASFNLFFTVLVINRNNLEASRERSEGKGHTLSLVFASLAVGQSVFSVFIIFTSHLTNPELGRFDSTPHAALLVIAHNTRAHSVDRPH